MSGLDHDLRALVTYSIKRADAAARAGVVQVLARHGLRRTTFSTLSVIGGTPGLNQAELAQTLAIERPNMTQIVDELLRAGLVERARAKADRRAYALTCSPAGEVRLAEATAALRAHDAMLAAGLSAAEKNLLIKALARIEAVGCSDEAGQRQRSERGADAISTP